MALSSFLLRLQTWFAQGTAAMRACRTSSTSPAKSSAEFLPTPASLPRSEVLGAVLIWLLLWVGWGLSLVQPTFSNGDAAVYLEQLLRGEYQLRTIHAGYLRSAGVWLEGLSGLGFPAWWEGRGGRPQEGPLLALHLHSVLWGGVAVGLLLRLERRLWGAAPVYWSPLLWLAMPPILKALTTAEVEPMAWALQLGALLAWLEGRALLAGVLWGAAFWVTPLVVVSLPVFGLLAPEGGAGRRVFFRLLLGLSLLPLLLLWLHGADWLGGPRGIWRQPEGMGRWDALERRLGELPAGLGLLLCLCGWSLARLNPPEGVKSLEAAWLRTLGASTLLAFLLDRFRDMPAYGFPAALLALWLSRAVRVPASWRMRGLLLGLLLLQGVLADQKVRASRREELFQTSKWHAQAAWLRQQPEPTRCLVGSFSTTRRFLYEACAQTTERGCLGLEPARVLTWSTLERRAPTEPELRCVVLELPERTRRELPLHTRALQ